MRHSSKLQPVAIDESPNPHIKMALESGRAAKDHGNGFGSSAPTKSTSTVSESEPHS